MFEREYDPAAPLCSAEPTPPPPAPARRRLPKLRAAILDAMEEAGNAGAVVALQSARSAA